MAIITEATIQYAEGLTISKVRVTAEGEGQRIDWETFCELCDWQEQLDSEVDAREACNAHIGSCDGEG